jgi:hypothetical protein
VGAIFGNKGDRTCYNKARAPVSSDRRSLSVYCLLCIVSCTSQSETVTTILSTGISVISLLKQGYDWITGVTLEQQVSHFAKQSTAQFEQLNAHLERIQYRMYRLPVREVYDTRYRVQQVIEDSYQIQNAVKPIYGQVQRTLVVSDPLVTPDTFRAKFQYNLEDFLFNIRPLTHELVLTD